MIVRIKPPKTKIISKHGVTGLAGGCTTYFFKTYTEKVWEVKADQIGADWASQRIKSLSLSKAIINAFKGENSGEVITTLIDKFKYPKFGPGMMWEATYEKLQKGHQVIFNSKVTNIEKTNKGYKVTDDSESSMNVNIFYQVCPLLICKNSKRSSR